MADFSKEILSVLRTQLNYLFAHLFSIEGLLWEWWEHWAYSYFECALHTCYAEYLLYWIFWKYFLSLLFVI